MPSNRIAAALLWLALLLAVAVVATQLRVSTDMSAFLPRGGGADEQLLLTQLQRGSSARILLLAIAAKSESQAAHLSSALAAELRKSSHFERVLNGELQLAATTEQPWFRYRYLLRQSDLSAEALQRALHKRLQELRSPLGLYTRQTLPSDPTAAFRQLLQGWQGGDAPERRHGVWFAADSRALLFAETRAAGFDLDAQQQNLAAIHNAFKALPGNSAAELIISGAPAIAVASRETIRSEAQWASIAATIAVALILLLAYRSWRLWLLSALPLAGAMLAALAVTTLTFGTVHGITVAFGITLLGVAIDYPIHFFSHLSRAEAPGRSLLRIWPTLRLGVISTAIGFAALLFTRFEGLVQLGVFAISGLLAAALITRYLLTPLLPSPWTGREYRAPTAAGKPVVGGWISLSLLAVSLSYLGLGDRPLWESDIAALSPVPESIRAQDRALREALPVSDLNRLLLMQAGSAESLLQAQEKLRPQLENWVGEGVIGGYTLAADRLPSAARQRLRQQALPDKAQLQQRLQQAGEGLPFRAAAFAPFVEAVAKSRNLPPLTPADVQDTALGLPLAGLLFERDGHWWGVVRLAGVGDVTALQQHLATMDTAIRYVDLKQVTGTMLEQFRDNALRNLLWGVVAIALIIVVGSRGGGVRLVRVMLPLSAAIAVTLALLHGMGERLTLFHLTSLLLVAGIGIDYGLFFSRTDAPGERGRTLHALRVCATSTATVFAILALSRLPVLHAIGLTVLIGVIAAYWLARLSGAGIRDEAGSALHNQQT